MTKKELRSYIKNQVAVHQNELQDFSKKICSDISSSLEFLNSQIIFSYMPLKDEVNLLLLVDSIFSSGKKIALPRVDVESGSMDFYLFDNPDDFKRGTEIGYCGIQEPSQNIKIALEKINPLLIKEKALILVPGRAFTKSGLRLGRGKGFYDSYLARLCRLENFYFAGVCFPFQIVNSIPVASNDIPVHKVFSCF